jgi:hypothetical protein
MTIKLPVEYGSDANVQAICRMDVLVLTGSLFTGVETESNASPKSVARGQVGPTKSFGTRVGCCETLTTVWC